jgi:hypothetical protein
MARRAQSLSGTLAMILAITVLTVVIVTAIVANSQFVSLVDTHTKARMAMLIATRLTGAPEPLMDWGREGPHKNLVDSRQLDLLSSQGPTMPYYAYTYCYNWRAEAKDSDSGKTWNFGQGAAFTTQPGYSLPTNLPPGNSIGDMIKTAETESYILPITLVNYRGNRLINYTFGTLQIFVWKNTTQCSLSDDTEKQYEEALRLYTTLRQIPPVTSATKEMPYLEKTFQGKTYLRCEELDAGEILRNFGQQDAEFISVRGPALTSTIEGAAASADVDPNLLRAVAFEATAFDPLIPFDYGVVASNLRAAIDTLPPGQCLPNYVAYSYLAGPDSLARYISGDERPPQATTARAQKIVVYYESFSTCRGLA